METARQVTMRAGAARVFRRLFLGALGAGLCLVAPTRPFAHDAVQAQIRTLSRSITKEPRNADLYLRRGEAYRVLRQWAGAAADYERSRQLEPNLAVVDYCQGRMLFEAGRAKDAVAPLDRFLGRVPGDPPALALRGRVKAVLGRHQEAAADATLAIDAYLEEGSAPPEVYIERARELVAAGDARRPEALAGLESGLARLGRPITLELEALDLEIAMGRTDPALARVSRLSSAFPQAGAWLLRRGEVLERAGRIAEARAAYEAARSSIAALPAPRRNVRAIQALDRLAGRAIERLDLSDVAEETPQRERDP